MLESTVNLALGFFGHPIDDQYQQVVMVQSRGVCSSLRSHA